MLEGRELPQATHRSAPSRVHRADGAARRPRVLHEVAERGCNLAVTGPRRVLIAKRGLGRRVSHPVHQLSRALDARPFHDARIAQDQLVGDGGCENGSQQPITLCGGVRAEAGSPHDRFTAGTATAPQLPPTIEAIQPPPMPVFDGQWIQRLVAGTGVIGIESRAVFIGRQHAHAIVDCCVTDTLVHVWDAGGHVRTIQRTTTGPIRNPAVQRRGRVKQQPKSKRQASTGT